MYAAMSVIFIGALALFMSTIFRSIGREMIFNIDALMIVLGGTTVAIFIGFPPNRLKKTVQTVIDAFRPLTDRQELAQNMLDLARTSRKADIRDVERKIRATKDDFLRLGMNLLLTHRTNEEIRTIMERAMASRMTDFRFSQNVLKTIARLVPAFGLAGTVISLIRIFATGQPLDDIALLLGTAMISTFYGVIISSLFILPLSAKLEERAIQSESIMQGIIEGIEAINDLQNPLHVEERISGNYEGERGSLARLDAFAAAGHMHSLSRA